MTTNQPLQNVWRQLRRRLQSDLHQSNDDWEKIRAEAARLLADLEGKYNDIVQQAQQTVERRRQARQKPIVRFIRRHRWLSIATGLAAIMAVVVATRSK